jgi:hypothetical protein
MSKLLDMKKLIFILLFIFWAAFAQNQTPSYDKYSVGVSVGSTLLREPFSPRLYTSATFGYKFAANYDKFFDKAYFTFSHCGVDKGSTGYVMGLQRTMINERDRMGLIGVVEAGTTRSSVGVFRPEFAVGLGVGFDFNGNPYPKFLNKTTLSLVPKLVEVPGRPVSFILPIGLTKTFK